MKTIEVLVVEIERVIILNYPKMGTNLNTSIVLFHSIIIVLHGK